MAERPEAFGMDAELAAKIRGKYDPQLELEVRNWVKDITGAQLSEGPDAIQSELKNGAVLSEIANALKPGSFKSTAPQKMPFKQMEVINAFLKVAGELGVPVHNLFQTVDLFDNTNMGQVILCLNTLRLRTEGKGGLDGVARKALPRSDDVNPIMAQGSAGGANQAGMSFGLRRQPTARGAASYDRSLSP